MPITKDELIESIEARLAYWSERKGEIEASRDALQDEINEINETLELLNEELEEAHHA